MSTKKRSTVLATKINELERLINYRSTLCDDDLQRAEIDQTLTFVKNLLTAETASHPTKHHYLETMLERVRDIEAAYRGGGSMTTTAASCVSMDSTIDRVDNVGVHYCYDDDDDDLGLNCSCELESTLGQDCVDGDEEKKAKGPMMVFDNALFEEKVNYVLYDNVLYDNVLYDDGFRNVGSVEDEINAEKEIGSVRAEVDRKVSHDEKKINNRCLGFVKLCGAVLSGIIIGMFSMVMLGSLEDEQCLVPT